MIGSAGEATTGARGDGVAQHPIEVILAQRLLAHLSMPGFLVDADGEMLFYNDAAEDVIGLRYDETGSVPMAVWATALSPRDDDGRALTAEETPVVEALAARRPVHRSMHLRGLDGVDRTVTGTAVPLEGQGGRHLGVMALFWEDGP